MSAAVRQELAAVANSVAGVNVHPYYRQGGKALSGNVVRGTTTFPNTFGGVVTWEVHILLPVDVESAQKKADELIPLLWEAFIGSRVMTVDDISFATSSQDNRSGQPLMVLTGHRETE
jgi:hypothetical protein